jgi:hypothetical protein
MKKRLILFSSVIIFAVSLSAVLIDYHFLTMPQQNLSESWMFTGAYASYQGYVVSFSAPYNISAKIQVTDLNASHVQIQTNSRIETSFAPALEDQSILWLNKTDLNFQPPSEMLAKKYGTQITVNGLGTRDCITYEYVNDGINVTYYVDKVVQWPVKLVYTTIFEKQTYSLEFYLKETNIIELKT